MGVLILAVARACPAYDPAAVLAAADEAASQGAEEPGPAGIDRSPPNAVEDEADDRARFERLLGDLDPAPAQAQASDMI